MTVRHFYHVWADGYWQQAVWEHARAVKAAGMPVDDMLVTIVGRDPARRDRVRGFLAGEFPGARFAYADEGYEQVTIQAIAASVADGQPATVLYAHSKGAYHPDEIAILHRRAMTYHLVGHWQHCLELLADYDAVGCHWKEPERYFAGNFWWANASYLRTLPPVAMGHRADAEAWIGRGNPRAYDMLPGWPHEDLYRDMRGGIPGLFDNQPAERWLAL